MALSDYATLAINENGEFCKACIEGFSGTGAIAEIYKNWVYVVDPAMFAKKQFTHNTIAHITDGDINLSDFHIVAKRYDDQAAVFVFIMNFKKTPPSLVLGMN